MYVASLVNKFGRPKPPGSSPAAKDAAALIVDQPHVADAHAQNGRKNPREQRRRRRAADNHRREAMREVMGWAGDSRELKPLERKGAHRVHR